jgi:hypothetical protein
MSLIVSVVLVLLPSALLFALGRGSMRRALSALAA